MEAVNLPNRLFHGLYYLAYQRMSTDEGKQSLAMENMMGGLGV